MFIQTLDFLVYQENMLYLKQLWYANAIKHNCLIA